MHRLTRIGLILACLIPYALSAQNQQKADSVLFIIENRNLTSEEKMDAYYWLSAYSSSPEDELKYGTTLLELANEAGSEEYRIKANQRIGVANRLMGNLSKALAYLFASANEASADEKYIPLLADIYTEIATCYTQNGDSENALRYGQKTIEMLRKTDRKQELAFALLNLGYDYYLIGNYELAISNYNESEPLLEEIGMEIGLAYIIGNRALVYWKQGNNSQAKEDLFQAIEMLEPFGDLYGMADYYNQLGNIFYEENNKQEAISYTMQGLEMAKQEGLKEQVRDASQLLFLLYRSIGDYQKAINYQTQFHAYKDSIQNLESTQRLADLRTEYEVGQKQTEVDLLLEQKRSNQIIMITGGILFVIVLLLAIIVYSYSKYKTRLNQQLEEQKNALITLNNTKDKFFSIISHDLRGPVNVMLGLVSVTKYMVDDKKNGELMDMLDKMENSVEHLVKLLDNLLHWALQQRGHFPYVPENLNVSTLLTETSDMFSDMAKSKNITLKISISNETEVHADKNTVSTIFRNLLNNAIKFTPNGGTIQLIAEQNSVPGLIIIQFIDSGVGMSKTKLKSLFKLNENITTKGTAGESGLGLGLQLVYDFIQLNKGEIDVESEEGKGTTFTIGLPVAKNEPEIAESTD